MKKKKYEEDKVSKTEGKKDKDEDGEAINEETNKDDKKKK